MTGMLMTGKKKTKKEKKKEVEQQFLKITFKSGFLQGSSLRSATSQGIFICWVTSEERFKYYSKTTVNLHHIKGSLITNTLFTSFILLKETVLEIGTSPRMNN